MEVNRLIILLLEIKIKKLFKRSDKLVTSIKVIATEKQTKEYSRINRSISVYFDTITNLKIELNK